MLQYLSSVTSFDQLNVNVECHHMSKLSDIVSLGCSSLQAHRQTVLERKSSLPKLTTSSGPIIRDKVLLFLYFERKVISYVMVITQPQCALGHTVGT